MNITEPWKVIIADDEAIIREGIRTTIDWEKLDLTLAGEAEDGEEALELAIVHQADIMLVDLSMPIMNGLTLIQHIHEKLPACKIIIITGHDEFAYAQEAIKLEVSDYILKPVNPEHLSRVLEAVTAKLRNRTAEQHLLQAASKQVEKHIDLLRDRFCLEWMRGELSLDEIREQLLFLNLPQSKIGAVCVVRWQEQGSNKAFYSERDRQLLLFAIENIAIECMQDRDCIHFRDYEGNLVFLLCKLPAAFALDRMRESVSSYLKIDILLSCIEYEQDFDGIHMAYQEAKSNVYNESRLSPLIKRMKDWIDTRYMDPELSLEALSKTFSISPVYASRLFKQEVGRSFISYLTYVRIRKAIELLHATDRPIHEIAELTGYESQHYFSTAFKKTIGLSPNQYRKR